MRARAAGRQPSELMPPIENELAEDDFNTAVVTRLYRFESAERWRLMKAHARLTAEYTELLRLGGTIPDDEPIEAATPGPKRDSATCEHVNCRVQGSELSCLDCGLRNDNGVLRYGESAPACEGHSIVNGICTRCGGHEVIEGLVTKPSPRIIGGCEHKRHVPEGGQLRCLDCGLLGN